SYDLIYHFIRWGQNSTLEDFVEFLDTFLAKRYGFETAIPASPSRYSQWINDLFHEVSRQLEKIPGMSLLLVIDALDEIDRNDPSNVTEGRNLLFLPETLPSNIILLTS